MKGLFLLLALWACQSAPAETQAVLVSSDAATMEKVRDALADAMGRARVELGPGDLTLTSRVSVLPPPLGPHETRSLAAPTQFDLVLRNGACYAVRADTGAEHALTGVACRAAK
ncbi:MAG: hypothetical protein JNJ73_13865 [Hyphomonadaceae bacterium]|nr:hypothetical protein [Hyphomonadaceae bacterium]